MDSGKPLKSIKNSNSKKKLRQLVYGSMAVGGALGMAGMTAQAHGNASSHLEAALAWNFDDFVIQRESLVKAYPNEIETLTGLQDQDREFGLQRNTYIEADVNFADNIRDASDLGKKLSRIISDKITENRILSNQILINSVKQATALTPMSAQVLQHLSNGETEKAIALIEIGDSVDDVLSRYSVVQLDLYNYGAVNQFSTATFTSEILDISKAALEYQNSNARDNLGARAGFLHNMASAALPDRGTATKDQTSTGKKAAEEALEIRQKLQRAENIGIAEYMVGVYDYRAGDYKAASTRFEASLDLLGNQANQQDVIWSKLFLGFSKLNQDDQEGQELINQARAEFEESNNDYGLQYADSLTRTT